MEEIVLYTWFGDRFVDSMSAKGVAMHRALVFKGLPFSVNYIYYPNEQYKFKLAMEALPMVKHGKLTIQTIWHLCEYLDDHLNENPLIPQGNLKYDVYIFSHWLLESVDNSLIHYRWVDENNFKTHTDEYNKLSGHKMAKDISKKLRSDILIFNRRHSEIGHLNEDNAFNYIKYQLKCISHKLEDKTFLFGENICIADIIAYGVISSLLHPHILQTKILLNSFPLITAWLKEFEAATKGPYSKEIAA